MSRYGLFTWWLYNKIPRKVTKYGLNCDKSFISALFTSTLFLGYCSGSFIGGVLSDRFGRKERFMTHRLWVIVNDIYSVIIYVLYIDCVMKNSKRTFTLLMLLFIVFQLSLMFIENLYTYQIMRFLQVASSVGAFGPMVTYVYEICGKKYRSGQFSFNMTQRLWGQWTGSKTEKAINCIVVGIPWSVGYSVTALIAQLTRDWFQMLVMIACITAPWPLVRFSFQATAWSSLIISVSYLWNENLN